MWLNKCLLIGTVALFLIMSYMPMLTSALDTTVKKLNESAILSCNTTCTGVMRWMRNGQIVAECGPGAANFSFTCEINQGKSSFTVALVNFSTRGYYSVFCGQQEMFQCRQYLQLFPPEDVFVLDAGDRLKLDLRVHDPVNVEFSQPGNSSTVELCRVDGRRRQCRAEYEQRVFIVENFLVLMDVKPSDSGNYSIRNTDRTLVSSLNVTVTERSSRVPTSAEREKHDLKHFFISTEHDLHESSKWKDGYWKGIWTAALVAVIVGLFCVIAIFLFWKACWAKGASSFDLLICCSHKDQSIYNKNDILLISPKSPTQNSKE